jgi:hypothetical protein
MADPITIEIIGFKNADCSPFPCNEERTCGLSDCYPTNKLTSAFRALETALKARYGDRVSLSLTLLDTGVPSRIRAIIEEHHPALPAVLVDGKVTPIGRIALERIVKEIEKTI